jgi:hypothetical protein
VWPVFISSWKVTGRVSPRVSRAFWGRVSPWSATGDPGIHPLRLWHGEMNRYEHQARYDHHLAMGGGDILLSIAPLFFPIVMQALGLLTGLIL